MTTDADRFMQRPSRRRLAEMGASMSLTQIRIRWTFPDGSYVLEHRGEFYLESRAHVSCGSEDEQLRMIDPEDPS